MEASKAFHILGDKHISSSAQLLQWSPKFDLVAMVSRDGAVSLHRSSSWQKIWEIGSDVERTGTAVAVAWRPDSRMIAVGYEQGLVRVFTLENAVMNGIPQGPACVHEVNTTSSPGEDESSSASSSCAVCHLSWFAEAPRQSAESDLKYEQCSESLRPDVPNVSVNWLGNEQRDGSCRRELGLDMKEDLLPGDTLDVLAVGTSGGRVRLFLCGLLMIVDVQHDAPIADVRLSSDLSVMTVIAAAAAQGSSGAGADSSDRPSSVPCRHVHRMTMFGQRRSELAAVCRLYGAVMSMCNYLSWSLQIIIDSWEDVMEQINGKLSAMSTELSGALSDAKIGSVLLRLLTRGTLPWQAAVFLERELSEGALLRVSTRLTSCYDIIRKTVVHSLQPVLLYLIVKCQDALGFAVFKYKFSSLGLSEQAFQKCIDSVASLTLKSSELISVMLTSYEDIASFLKWLQCTSAMLQSRKSSSASEEQTPPVSMTRAELCRVGKFIVSSLSCEAIGNSNGASAPREQQFNIEKVGQYLRNEALTSRTKEPWTDNGLMQELRQMVEKLDWSFRHDSSTSLVQDYWSMEAVVCNAFAAVAPAFTGLVVSESSLSLPPSDRPARHVSGYVHNTISSAIVPDDGAVGGADAGVAHLVMHQSSVSVVVFTGDGCRALNLHLQDGDESVSYRIADAQWYSEKGCLRAQWPLCMLLSHASQQTLLVRLDVEELLAQFVDVDTSVTRHLVVSSEDCVAGDVATVTVPSINAFPLLSRQRDVELHNVAGFAVSGDRELSVVMAANCRYVKFYDMAQEEEDDDDDDDDDDDEEPCGQDTGDDSMDDGGGEQAAAAHGSCNED